MNVRTEITCGALGAREQHARLAIEGASPSNSTGPEFWGQQVASSGIALSSPQALRLNDRNYGQLTRATQIRPSIDGCTKPPSCMDGILCSMPLQDTTDEQQKCLYCPAAGSLRTSTPHCRSICRSYLQKARRFTTHLKYPKRKTMFFTNVMMRVGFEPTRLGTVRITLVG